MTASSVDYTYPLTEAELVALQVEAVAFQTATDCLSGVGNPAPYGPLDVILHDTTISVLGDDPDPTYATATVIAPLQSASTLINTAAAAQTIIASLLAGTIVDADAASAIATLTTTLANIIAASTNAVSNLRTILPTLATAEAFAAATVSGSPALQAYVASIVQPAVLSQLQTQAEAEFFVEPPTLVPQAENINQSGVIGQWVAAYMAQTGSTS